MRKALVALAAVGLVAAATAAFAEEGAVPPCADFQELDSSSYTWAGDGGTLDLQIELATDACSDVDYNLWVVRDAGFDPSGFDPNNTAVPPATIFDVEGPYEPGTAELLTVTPTVSGNTLSYSVEVDDNDPTLCIFSEAVRTTTVSEEADANGNGTTQDDQHKGKDGDNRDGSKFEWETTSTSSTLDRAPNVGCRDINLVWDSTVMAVDGIARGSGGSRGYN